GRAPVRRRTARLVRHRVGRPSGRRAIDRRVRAVEHTAARAAAGADVRAALRRRRTAGDGRQVARDQSDRSAALGPGRRNTCARRRALAHHRALTRRGVHAGGDNAVADRAKRSSVLRLALPALLVAAFILASTPAAEAHNTWTGGYRKWPWRGSDDRTLTTLPGECPHCPG